MLIRNFFLSAALYLMLSAMSCSSNTPSEYLSKDHDRAERNMEIEQSEGKQTSKGHGNGSQTTRGFSGSTT